MTKIILLIILVLLVAVITFIVIQYFTFKRGIRHIRQYTIGTKEVTVSLHFTHRLPKWLKRKGFAMGDHIWFFFPQANIYREDAIHELGHDVMDKQLGPIWSKVIVIWEWATQWVWKRRSTEEDARRAELLLVETGEGYIPVRGKMVYVNAPWLVIDFPNRKTKK